MHDEQLRAVLDRLLATRRAKAEDTQGGARKGLRILFAGHSGKNKLLAAQLFAHELSVDLIQIDLERIVSQFVRDTEKNLDALYKAARLRTPCSCSTTRITCLPANRPPGIPVAIPGSTSPSCDSASKATTAWSC